MTEVRTVCHYGPPPGGPGGMSSVLDAYSSLPLQRYRFEFRGTWSPDARWHGAADTSRAGWALLRDRAPLPLTHVHLSERGSFLREGGLAALAHLRREGVVASLHGADMAPFLEAHPQVARATFRNIDVVVALGTWGAELVAPYLRPNGRIEVIANPIEVPHQTSPAGDHPPVALFGGEVGTRKGADVLLEAWPKVRAAVPDARLLIAGPSGDVQPRAVDGVEWIGELTRPDLVRRIESVRVVALPSRAEVMPMFLLEAMIRARPIVSTAVGEIEQMVGGVDDCLTSPGDADRLASLLAERLSDPDLATGAGDALRRRALVTSSPTVVAAALERVYDSLA